MKDIQVITEDTVLEFLFETKISQTELVRRARIGRKTIYNFLYCKHKPSLYVQSRLYHAMKEIRRGKKNKAK